MNIKLPPKTPGERKCRFQLDEWLRKQPLPLPLDTTGIESSDGLHPRAYGGIDWATGTDKCVFLIWRNGEVVETIPANKDDNGFFIPSRPIQPGETFTIKLT